MENDRAGYPIAIIIAVNDDIFTQAHRGNDPINGAIHVEDQERVIGVCIIVWAKKSLLSVLRDNAAIYQQLFRDGMHDAHPNMTGYNRNVDNITHHVAIRTKSLEGNH